MSKPCDHISRVDKLAAFTARFRQTGASFATFAPMEGKGTADNPFRMPYSKPTQLGNDFFAMVHDAGWIKGGFDWSAWTQGAEGRHLANDRDAIAYADEDQLAMLLTALVRQDRFIEGALAGAFDSGLLLAIAERAEKLSKE